jgi:hypothetical protein
VSIREALRAIPTGIGAAPSFRILTSRFEGNFITVEGTVTDPDADLFQMLTRVLDAEGAILTRFANAQFEQPSTTTNFVASFFLRFIDAVRGRSVSLVMADHQGNRTLPIVADPADGDGGGPRIRSVTLQSPEGALIIKGSGFQKNRTALRINGSTVQPPIKIKVKGAGTKLKITASRNDLHLLNGRNGIVAVDGQLRSNVFILEIPD